jgi:hypothetical protein
MGFTGLPDNRVFLQLGSSAVGDAEGGIEYPSPRRLASTGTAEFQQEYAIDPFQ